MSIRICPHCEVKYEKIENTYFEETDCPNFENHGKRFPKTRYLLKQKGYTENDPRLKKCPIWLKKSYLEEIPFCEGTGVSFNLEIHRIKRGNLKGLYNADNVKILNEKRHKMHHFKEPGCR